MSIASEDVYMLEREPSLLTEDNLVRHSTMYTRAQLSKTELMARYQSSVSYEYKKQKRKSRHVPAPSPSPVSSLDTTTGSSNQSIAATSRRSRRYSIKTVMPTDNIALDAPPMPFPYHNDAVFVPAAEQHQSCVTTPRSRQDSISALSSVSPVPSLIQGGRRSSSPVWWVENEGTATAELSPKRCTSSNSISPARVTAIASSDKPDGHPLSRRIVLQAGNGGTDGEAGEEKLEPNMKKWKSFGQTRRWFQRTWRRMIGNSQAFL
ncbi:hypothetical protein BDB00DRAFT_799880 [Zychaea mexicana]|uniref:uncharacterized protein n=1 Tax=Zychaea mexicana TaxID=64656 RepID=UPI0022FE4D0D|nr:uncharacterized protein BDB00DRAFT_799880 [Zychaea mexicana]KAI9498339.1 hypothetical protein BDB00DRAFT_799880 [Zychaea mexicana]